MDEIIYKHDLKDYQSQSLAGYRERNVPKGSWLTAFIEVVVIFSIVGVVTVVALGYALAA